MDTYTKVYCSSNNLLFRKKSKTNIKNQQSGISRRKARKSKLNLNGIRALG